MPVEGVGSRERGALDHLPPTDARQRAHLPDAAQVRRSLDGQVARRGRATPARPRSRVDGARPTPSGIAHEAARAARTRHDPRRRSTRPAGRPGPDRGRCDPRRGRGRMASVHRVRPQAPAVDRPRLSDLRRQDPGAGAGGRPDRGDHQRARRRFPDPARGRGPPGSANDQQVPRADPRRSSSGRSGCMGCRRTRPPAPSASPSGGPATSTSCRPKRWRR